MTDLKPLTELSARLAEIADGAPGYRVLYGRILDGRLPMLRQVNGRWHFAPADLPDIAAALGLAQKPLRKSKRALAFGGR